MRRSFALLVLLTAAACGPAPTSGGGDDDDAGGGDESDAPPRPDSRITPTADAPPSLPGDMDGDGVTDAEDNCLKLGNPDQSDTDGDDFGNACDCDPLEATIAGTTIFDDAMSAETGMFSSPVGFTGANWMYGPDVDDVSPEPAPNTGMAYRQTRLANDAEDAAFFFGNTLLENVRVDVRVASTAIQDFGAGQNLRQIFIIARAASTGSTFRAQACGIEVVDGLAPTQRTSTVTLGGTPSAVTSTVRTRTARRAVQVDEELELHMVLEGQMMTCTANLFTGTPETTTASASELNVEEGAVGFFTNETRALFKNVRICELP